MSLTIRVHTSSHFNLHPRTIKQRNFTNFNIKIRPRPIYSSNPLTVYRHKMNDADQISSSSGVIKSSLIDPDGVVLVVPESEQGPKTIKAESMPNVKLTKIDLEWVHVIRRVCILILSKMKDGSIINMSLPIVLAIDDETKDQIGSAQNVGLLGPTRDLIGILRRSYKMDSLIPRLPSLMHYASPTAVLDHGLIIDMPVK